MKYFIFSFYIKSSTVPSHRRALPAPSPRAFLMSPSSYPLILLCICCVSACPLLWALPKDRAHTYFIPHGHLVPSTTPDTVSAPQTLTEEASVKTLT